MALYRFMNVIQALEHGVKPFIRATMVDLIEFLEQFRESHGGSFLAMRFFFCGLPGCWLLVAG